jgi:hypothetical protein
VAVREPGYFFARSTDGTLVVSERDPGADACRISWKPSGEITGDKPRNFRVSLEAWEKIVDQKIHEREMVRARAQAEKVKNGTRAAANLRGEKTEPSF